MDVTLTPRDVTYVHGGFDAYVVLEKEKGSERRANRLQIHVNEKDTAHTLKGKKNGGVCEYVGCDETNGLEWHHHDKTWAVEGVWGGVWGEKQGVYRKISGFYSSTNPAVHEVYSHQIHKCTLLCKKHHTHTHTHHSLQKRLLLHQYALQHHTAMFAALAAEHGVEKALKAIYQIRKAGGLL
jgi:hypothetical protein